MVVLGGGAVSYERDTPVTPAQGCLVYGRASSYWSYWSFNEHSTSAANVGVSLDSTLGPIIALQCAQGPLVALGEGGGSLMCAIQGYLAHKVRAF